MRFIVLFVLLWLSLTGPQAAQEIATLATPVHAEPGLTTVRPARITLDIEQGIVSIVVKQWVKGAFVVTGPVLEVTYDATTVPTGLALVRALNTVNLSSVSLQRRILQQLVTSGHLSSAIFSGTPE